MKIKKMIAAVLTAAMALETVGTTTNALDIKLELIEDNYDGHYEWGGFKFYPSENQIDPTLTVSIDFSDDWDFEDLVMPETVNGMKVTYFDLGSVNHIKCKTITIPSSLNFVLATAFYSEGWGAREAVYFEGTKEQWDSIDFRWLIGGGKTYIGHMSDRELELYVPAAFPDSGDSDPVLVLAPDRSPSYFIFGDTTIYFSDGTSVKTTDYYGADTPSTGAPELNDVRATTTVNGTTQTLTVDANGNVDVTGLENGTYTFTFSANYYAPRIYDVTVSSGKVTKGLENGVELHLLGDINGDGVVNTQDVAKANAHVKGTSTLKGYDLTCINVNNDANINVQDVALMNAHAKNTKLLW